MLDFIYMNEGGMVCVYNPLFHLNVSAQVSKHHLCCCCC